MRNLIFASLAIICLFSCSTIKKIPPTVIRVDSTRVEYRDRIIHDTVEFVPPEFFASQISNDTLSIIESDYAKTVAVVHDGLLSHSLESKPTVIRIPVAVEVHDTLVVTQKGETIIECVPVEKKLTWWQDFKIKFGGFMLFVSVSLFLAVGLYFMLKRIQ